MPDRCHEQDDEELLQDLEVVGPTGRDDITVLKHVSSQEERRAAEELANRAACRDFERFESPYSSRPKAILEGTLE